VIAVVDFVVNLLAEIGTGMQLRNSDFYIFTCFLAESNSLYILSGAAADFVLCASLCLFVRFSVCMCIFFVSRISAKLHCVFSCQTKAQAFADCCVCSLLNVSA